jgi:hypothetical protein
MAERATAFGVRLTLRDPLAVEVGHLLDQIVIVEQNRAIRPHGQRELIAGHRNTGIRRRRNWLCIAHYRLAPVISSWTTWGDQQLVNTETRESWVDDAAVVRPSRGKTNSC